MATLTDKVEEFVEEILENPENEKSFLDKANKIQSLRKYRIKDYDKAISYFITKELELYRDEKTKGKVIDKTDIEKFELAKKLLEKAKEFRRDANRQTSPVDTNILTASPFFVGGSRKLKKKAKEQGYVSFEKDGLRRLTYHNETGQLLTYNDAKTLFALFALWEEQGNKNWVTFTIYQLLEKMNMGNGGKQYKIVGNSLEKLRNTSVVLQEAYDVKKGKRFVTERFNLIIADKLTVEEDDLGNLRSRTYEMQFSPYIYDSISNGYYSLISLALWDELDNDAAKAIYSMLSGIISMDSNEEYIRDNGSFEIPLSTVYRHLKLENPKPSRNKYAVEGACEELVEIDVIKNYYFIGKGNRAHTIVIEPSPWLQEILKKSNESRFEQLEVTFNELDEE